MPGYWAYGHLKQPFFEVSVKGKVLSEYIHQFIEEVTYEDHATGSDICSVTISDPHFEFISDPVFASAATFKLRGGWRLKNRVMMEGFISAVDYQFSSDNTPILVIHAMDKSHKLDRSEKKRSWNKRTRYQVVQTIARENGLGFRGKANSKANKKEDTITQSNETDIQFLMNLADECEMIIYVQGNTLFFHERNYDASSVGKFTYRNSPFTLIDFSPRLVQKDIPIEEDEQDVDVKKGKTEKGKANTTTPRPTTSSSSSGGKSGGKGKSYSDLRIEYDGDIKLK